MKMKQPAELEVLSDSIEVAAVKVLVRAKSIPETVRMTHVSSAFLLAAAAASSDALRGSQLNEATGCRLGHASVPDRSASNRPRMVSLLYLVFSGNPQVQEPAA